MIEEITKDMLTFLFMLGLAVIGFGNSFYMLAMN
jgi:hypothetical protein